MAIEAICIHTVNTVKESRQYTQCKHAPVMTVATSNFNIVGFDLLVPAPTEPPIKTPKRTSAPKLLCTSEGAHQSKVVVPQYYFFSHYSTLTEKNHKASLIRDKIKQNFHPRSCLLTKLMTKQNFLWGMRRV